MKTIAIVAFLTSLAQVGAMISRSLNVYNLPDRIILYKDIVKNPAIRDAIAKYSDEKNNLRIVGGDEVVPNSVPHQAAFIIDQTYFCGGSLISTTWILTAAHCVENAQVIEATLGAHNFLSGNEGNSQQKRISREFKIHPNWNPNFLRNDVGLIKLPSPVTLNKNISIVCLVPSNINIFVGTTMNATGWGKISDASTSMSPALRTVSIPTISNQQCEAIYGGGFINDGVICTSTTGGKGICNGDSGGPLIIKGKLINDTLNPRQCQAGITSFLSSLGCQQGKPAGFSRVAYFLDGFITKETGVLACNECADSTVPTTKAPVTSTTIRGTTSSSNINSCCLFYFIAFISIFYHIF